MSIGITSIGLDGEKIDNVTNKPKPRIKVYPKTIIATASDCLRECEFNFVIHENTNVRTPLGEVLIVEAVTEGLALVAGPSTNNEMVKVINKLQKYSCKKIFIDGALFRKSIASFRVAESCILATGASYNDDINVVIDCTKNMIDQLSIEEVRHRDKINIIKFKNHVYIDDQGHAPAFKETNLLGNEEIIRNYIHPKIRTIYINGALNDKMIDILIELRNEIKELNLVIKDGTHILASHQKVAQLKMIRVQLQVLNKLNLLFLTCNPVSPNGTVFDKHEFKKRLTEELHLPVFNVLEDY